MRCEDHQRYREDQQHNDSRFERMMDAWGVEREARIESDNRPQGNIDAESQALREGFDTVQRNRAEERE